MHVIRLTKLSDYGIVLLTFFARESERALYTARDLADESGLPLPTVSKILKALVRAELLASHRGVKGGYSLARLPNEISVAQIIGAIDGPIAVTDCSTHKAHLCDIERAWPVRRNWQHINAAVSHALGELTLAEMTSPISPTLAIAQRQHAHETLVQLPIGKSR